MTDVLHHHLTKALAFESQQHLSAIEEKAKHYEDSIRYAERIQFAILPNIKLFLENFQEALIMFKPKDIVSGDFYWIHSTSPLSPSNGGGMGVVYFAVGDCTGHGVPGALINMAGNTILRQIISNKGIDNPAEIIQQLDKELVGLFNDNLTQGITRDGMDITLCRYDLLDRKLYFCTAGRPLIIIRNRELIEFESDLYGVGYAEDETKTFRLQEFDLKLGDQIYLFSDGYTDQFGGDNIKKFNRKRFRNLLTSISEFPMNRQNEELNTVFEEWKGKHEQIDDVCVLGIRI
jgi:serine phosphatase RsbU (regulator of sigma subunit)